MESSAHSKNYPVIEFLYRLIERNNVVCPWVERMSSAYNNDRKLSYIWCKSMVISGIRTATFANSFISWANYLIVIQKTTTSLRCSYYKSLLCAIAKHCEKSSCYFVTAVHPSVCPHGTTRCLTDFFLWNFSTRIFTRICRTNLILVKIVIT